VDGFDVIIQGSERDLQDRFLSMEKRMRSSIIANAEKMGGCYPSDEWVCKAMKRYSVPYSHKEVPDLEYWSGRPRSGQPFGAGGDAAFKFHLR
jgi:hypothetical protein